MSGHDKNRVSSVREEDPIPKGVRGHKRQALKRSIKSRHMFMIALAGVIGTGLFLGTGDVINRAGPGGRTSMLTAVSSPRGSVRS